MYGYKFSILFKHPIMGIRLMAGERRNMKQRRAFGVGALDIENLDSYLNHVIATGVMSLLEDGIPPKDYKYDKKLWKTQMTDLKDGFLAAERIKREGPDLDEETYAELEKQRKVGMVMFLKLHQHLHM